MIKHLCNGLFLGLCGLASLSAPTQHQIVLDVPVAPNQLNEHCYGDITSETIDGQPFNLTAENTFSPFSNHCPNRTDGIGILLQPQPYFTFQDWVYVVPPAPSQVTRGAAVPASCDGLQIPPNGYHSVYRFTFTGKCFQAVDTFNYTDAHHNANWTGSVARQLAQFNECGTRSCVVYDADVSDVANATVTVN
jgi:hypothetical protein